MTTFAEFLAAYEPAVQQLAWGARRLILEVHPAAVELVDPPSKIVAYGFGERYADLVCAIAPYHSHANLIFSRGARLPDPAGLLSGAGKLARHVRLSHPTDLDAPALRSLLQIAFSAGQDART